MICEADATYEKGVLKLSRNIPIRDGTKVKVIILIAKKKYLENTRDL